MQFRSQLAQSLREKKVLVVFQSTQTNNKWLTQMF
jgi:protoheme ferro-lyase